MTKSEMKQR